VADSKSRTVGLLQIRHLFLLLKSPTAYLSGHALSGSDLRSLACWDCGFDSRREHRCLSVVNIGCCEVQVSAMGRSLIQRSPTECGVSLCDLETSTARLPRPEQGCNPEEKSKIPPTNELRLFILILADCRHAGLSYVLTRTLVKSAA